MGPGGYDGKKRLRLVAGRIGLLVPVMFILAGVPLVAQDVAAPAALMQQAAEIPAASFAFDVATIKPGDPSGLYFGGGRMGPDYYSLVDYPLSGIVFSAYYPGNSHGHDLIGMPAWAYKEHYDLVAHMDEATAASLAKLPRSQRQQANFVMLQKLLAERCKLVAHTVPSEVDGYILVVGKHGSLVTPTKPGETFPSGAKNGWNGAKVVSTSSGNNNTESYYNATMEDLATGLAGPGSSWSEPTSRAAMTSRSAAWSFPKTLTANASPIHNPTTCGISAPPAWN